MGQKALPLGPFSESLMQIISEQMTCTKSQLAERVGVSADTITAWFSTKRAMNVDNLASIAVVLGIRPSTLVAQAEELLLKKAMVGDVLPKHTQGDLRLAALKMNRVPGNTITRG